MKTTNHPVRWDRNRHVHFKIGLIVAILSVIFAFNWTISPRKYFESKVEMEDLDESITVRTIQEQKKKVLPPTEVSISKKTSIEDITEFTESPEPKMLDADILEPAKITNTEPTMLTNPKKPTPPPPPPPPPPIDDTEGDFEKVVEDMPRFPGCESLLTKAEKSECATRKLLSFLQENIKYPAFARENEIEGNVVIQFIVEKDGSVTKVKIIRDIGGGCGEEALRVVKKMPKWTAGRQRGRKVRVQYNLPVKFKLD